MSGRLNSLNNGYIGSSAEIPTCSVALGVVTPRKQYINALEINQWDRPDYWLKLPAISGSEQKIAGLFAVFKGASGDTGASADSNWTTFRLTTSSGNYVVDWGVTTASYPNGFTAAYASGVTAQYQYNWNDVPSSTLTPEGHRQVVVQMYPESSGANILGAYFNGSPAVTGLSFSGQFCEWLDFRLSIPEATQYSFSGNAHLKQVEFIGPTKKTASFPYTFNNCYGLERVIGTRWTENLNDAGRLFANCYSLRTIPLLDFRKVTSAYAAFDSCSSLHTFPCLNTSNATELSLFVRGTVLVEFPFLNTSKCTTMEQTFTNTYALESIPPLDTSKVTSFASCFNVSGIKKLPKINTSSATNMGTMFNAANRLKEIPLLDTSNNKNFGNFISSSGIETLPPIDTSKGQYFYQFAYNATVLKYLPVLSFAGVTGNYSSFANLPVMGSMFYRNRSLVVIPEWDLSGISFGSTGSSTTGNTGPLHQMFSDDSAQIRVMGLKGFKRSISLLNQTLSPTEINRVFTNLGDVSGISGGCTINITGCWGASAGVSGANFGVVDRTIATNKNWTVTG